MWLWCLLMLVLIIKNVDNQESCLSIRCGKGGKDCSCKDSCFKKPNCCPDFYDVCQSPRTTATITTTQEVITTTESAESTTIEEITTTESAESTTMEEITTTESADTTTTKEITTTESAETTTTEEITTTESAKTTTTEEITTTESAETTTEEKIITSESIKTTTMEETITTEKLIDCGPIPTWNNIKILYSKGQSVRYACGNRYSFSDNAEWANSVCNQYGIWEPDFEQCEENVNTTAEAMYREPTEAPGAFYIGSSALFIVIAEAVILFLMDVFNFKNSFSYCVKNIRGSNNDCPTTNSIDPERSLAYVPKLTTNSGLVSSSDLSIILIPGNRADNPTLKVQHLEVPPVQPMNKVAKENMVEW